MTAIRLTPVVLSLLVLAAHFLRAENTVLVVLVLAMIGLLFVKKPWSARTVQLVLVLGAFEWLLTLSGLVVRRVELGQPYGRMVMILGSVALLTAMSALVFRSAPLRERYGLGGSDVSAAGDVEPPRPKEDP